MIGIMQVAGRLGSMNKQEWLGSLEVGDPVVVRKPWSDGIVKGGLRHSSYVTKVSTLNDSEKTIALHVEGHHVFYPKYGGRQDPYSTLEMPYLLEHREAD